jgi:phospholipid/cholesterol/gamma-HCH transport system permease protein
MLTNYALWKFFAQVRGPVFAVLVMPAHLLYYLLNGISFGVGLPLLTICSSCISLLGALAVVTLFRDVPPETFFFGVRLFYADRDLIVGLLKAGVFGGWIALFGCWFGFNSARGAEGVGRAVLSAVVWANIAILVSGFVLSKLLLS